MEYFEAGVYHVERKCSFADICDIAKELVDLKLDELKDYKELNCTSCASNYCNSK